MSEENKGGPKPAPGPIEYELPIDDTSRPILESFEKSVEDLEATDRAAVMEQFNKLQRAFSLLGETMNKILSTEEARQIFEREMKKRQST